MVFFKIYFGTFLKFVWPDLYFQPAISMNCNCLAGSKALCDLVGSHVWNWLLCRDVHPRSYCCCFLKKEHATFIFSDLSSISPWKWPHMVFMNLAIWWVLSRDIHVKKYHRPIVSSGEISINMMFLVPNIAICTWLSMISWISHYYVMVI